MACNIQFIFYRRYVGDKDILFKVLRNENEATLPIKTDRAPYYHWKDFKTYFLKKLNNYDQKCSKD
jgi:NADPH-dependent 7-cyano-7-deazaguanine reductase QueF-like protein